MNNYFGVFYEEYWLLAVVTAVFLLLLFGLLEWLRPNRKPVVRISLTALAIACLLLIFLKPYYLSKSNGNVTIIFTEGHSHQDSLMDAYPNATVIYWSDTASITTTNSEFIIDGFGIPSYDLRKFDVKSVQFLPSSKPTGLIDFNYKAKVKVGENALVKLQVNQLANHQIIIKAQGTAADSAYIKNDSLQTIQLNYKPSSVGRVMLQFEAVNEKDEIVLFEQLPIDVVKEAQLKILVLNTQPTFESRFLKNYLMEQGHAVFTRSEITTNRYNFESSGFEFTRLDRLTEKSLEVFDLVVASSNTLSELSRSEKNALRNQVGEAGLGMILLQNDVRLSALPDWLRFKIKDFNMDEKFIEVNFSENKTKLEAPETTFVVNGLQESILSFQGEALAVVKPYGQGLVTSSVIDNTYKLALKGEKVAFEAFWNDLIESVLTDDPSDLIVKTKIPVEDEPVTLQLWSNDALPEVLYQSASLPIIQREFIPQRWSATVWPLGAGWQNITLNDMDYAFYVFDENDWQQVRNNERYEINRKYFSKGTVTTPKVNDVKIPISLWWFYLLFLCSTAYLWLQPKLS